jgi:hypothetical protein
VKSAELPAGPAHVTALAEAGLLDPAFPGLAAGFPGRIRLVHRDDLASRRALGTSGEAAGGTLVEPGPLSIPADARHHG